MATADLWNLNNNESDSMIYGDVTCSIEDLLGTDFPFPTSASVPASTPSDAAVPCDVFDHAGDSFDFVQQQHQQQTHQQAHQQTHQQAASPNAQEAPHAMANVSSFGTRGEFSPWTVGDTAAGGDSGDSSAPPAAAAGAVAPSFVTPVRIGNGFGHASNASLNSNNEKQRNNNDEKNGNDDDQEGFDDLDDCDNVSRSCPSTNGKRTAMSRAERLARNRESARIARRRKKLKHETLEKVNDDLRRQVETLRAANVTLEAENRVLREGNAFLRGLVNGRGGATSPPAAATSETSRGHVADSFLSMCTGGLGFGYDDGEGDGMSTTTTTTCLPVSVPVMPAPEDTLARKRARSEVCTSVGSGVSSSYSSSSSSNAAAQRVPASGGASPHSTSRNGGSAKSSTATAALMMAVMVFSIAAFTPFGGSSSGAVSSSSSSSFADAATASAGGVLAGRVLLGMQEPSPRGVSVGVMHNVDQLSLVPLSAWWGPVSLVCAAAAIIATCTITLLASGGRSGKSTTRPGNHCKEQ